MKIAILSFYSGIYNRGVERWTRELATRLSKKHKVVVFQNGSGDPALKYKIVSIKLSLNLDKKEINLPLQKRAFLDYRGRKIATFALKLLPALWKEDFDIIVPTDGGWEPAFIRILCWLRKPKMVIVGHAGLGWDDRNNLWTFPDCFVALSSYAKKWARKVNPFAKVENIPDGVDMDKFKPKGKKLKTGLEKPTVLCVGALTASKRIDLTINAVAKLKDVSLLVVGRGELKNKLVKQGENLLGKRFRLLQFDFNEMPRVYRSADVFTIPSLQHYSFEMVLLEAMATNLAVVANNDSIRSEIVGDAGILVDPTNTDAYANALKKALTTDWGNKPKKQAEKFSWDEIVGRYEDLFNQVVL